MKLALWRQYLGGDAADHRVLDGDTLAKTVAAQAQQIVQLRATVLGLIELVHRKVPFDDRELDNEVIRAMERIAPPPPPSPTDPYRGIPAGARADDAAAAQALLRVAEEHHRAQRFDDARTVYQQVIDRFGETPQAATATQQLANLRGI